MKQNMTVRGDRLWDSLMDMAKIGATEKGGSCRLALTDEDKEGRDLFIKWCEDAGCSIKIDKMGNIFARREGKNPDLPAVMTGSHLDTQPTGGKFDGVYGVLAGLEVLRALNDYEITTEHPVEVAVWTNEEGSRFAPSMVSSAVFAGAYDLEYGLSRADVNGVTMGEELKRIGYDGPEEVGGRDLKAFFEAHIEQGPKLEFQEKTIGVVTDVNGLRWYEITVRGQEAHAGPTPMNRRKDALVVASKMVQEVNRIGFENDPDACATVGMLDCRPNSRNTIPGEVFFTVDFRHPSDEVLTKMDGQLREFCEKVAREGGFELEFEQIMYTAPIKFDEACVDAVRKGAAEAGYSHMDIVSGAGHDACYLSRVAPTGMVFVPCENGISHNEEEAATPEDLAAGCHVLLHAMLDQAGVVTG